MKTLIKLESVSKHFGNFRALSNINLQVDEGEVLSVIGPSGSGKSTMIRCINLLEQYDSSGSIIVDNKLVKKVKHSGKSGQILAWCFKTSICFRT